MAKSKCSPEKGEVKRSLLAGASVLIVDDDPVFAQMASTYLIALGVDVHIAQHGVDGLRQLKNTEVDLVLCDLSMPVLNGVEFVEEVSMCYPSLPIIVVSATNQMSEVARALKYGIKDFLCKPITDYAQLSTAIVNTLEDCCYHMSDMRDFSSQWFQVDGGGELPELEELHWHLDYLQDHPHAARELLLALMPDPESTQGDWTCSYRLLQSADAMPFVFEYAWIINGQLVFYAVDTNEKNGGGIATTLLIRALFHDYLRNIQSLSADLQDLVTILEKGIAGLECACPVPIMIGVADLSFGYLSILSAGLNYTLTLDGEQKTVAGGNMLGDDGERSCPLQEMPIYRSGQISVSSVGANSFVFELVKKSLSIE